MRIRKPAGLAGSVRQYFRRLHEIALGWYALRVLVRMFIFLCLAGYFAWVASIASGWGRLGWCTTALCVLILGLAKALPMPKVWAGQTAKDIQEQRRLIRLIRIKCRNSPHSRSHVTLRAGDGKVVYCGRPTHTRASWFWHVWDFIWFGDGGVHYDLRYGTLSAVRNAGTTDNLERELRIRAGFLGAQAQHRGDRAYGTPRPDDVTFFLGQLGAASQYVGPEEQ